MFWIEIKPFQPIIILIYMVAKLDFSKGLVHECGKKFEISSLLVSGQNSPKNCVLGLIWIEIKPFQTTKCIKMSILHGRQIGFVLRG